MSESVHQRVQKSPDMLRESGVRPIQISAPESRRPDFVDECRRQSIITTAADAADPALDSFIEAALNDLDPEGRGWR